MSKKKDDQEIVVEEGSPLQNAILQREKFSKAKKLPKQKRVQPPKSVERAYEQALRQMIAEAQKEFRNLVVPAIKGEYVNLDDPKTELTPLVKRSIVKFAERLSQKVFPKERIENLAATMARRLDVINAVQIAKAYDRLTPIDLQSVIPQSQVISEAFVIQNTALIAKVSEEITANVSRIVLDKTIQGARWESIVNAVEKGLDGKAGVFKSVRNRAKLIARDQTNKMNGQLTRARQENLGVKLYRWRAVNDNRTRPSHADRDGKIFSWSGNVTVKGKTFSETPDGLTPGEDINCRCVAEAVIEV
jgi:SPP1 gp7 family putative phage head morphogenesis protein